MTRHPCCKEYIEQKEKDAKKNDTVDGNEIDNEIEDEEYEDDDADADEIFDINAAGKIKLKNVLIGGGSGKESSDDDINDNIDNNIDDHQRNILVKAFQGYGDIMLQCSTTALSTVCLQRILPNDYTDSSWDSFLDSVKQLTIHDRRRTKQNTMNNGSASNAVVHQSDNQSGRKTPTNTSPHSHSASLTVTGTPHSPTTPPPRHMATPPTPTPQIASPAPNAVKRRQVAKGGPASIKRQRLEAKALLKASRKRAHGDNDADLVIKVKKIRHRKPVTPSSRQLRNRN